MKMRILIGISLLSFSCSDIKPLFDKSKDYTPVAPAKNEPKEEKPANDRFKLVQLGSMRRDQYLLDTQTGKIWRSVCVKPIPKDPAGCNFSAWETEIIEDITHSGRQILEMAK